MQNYDQSDGNTERSGYKPAVFGRLLACLFLMAFGGAGLAAERPNVIVVLADDLGWMDSGVYGSEYYDTPNIDRLAGMGVRFTDAYAANPLCSPTRLSVLTGQVPHRYGMTAPAGHMPALPPNTPLYGERGAPWQPYVVPNTRRHLPDDADTYGKAFKAAGYRTAFMGKWHLGKAEHGPDKHGFDLVVGAGGFPGPPGGYFAPWSAASQLPNRPAGTHIDDAITDEAIAFITDNQKQPFLLNLWFYDVHGPFQGKADLIQKYRQKTDPRGFQDCPTMGAMIETLDFNLGRVLDTLEELGLDDNTIIVFWSDNGGNMYDTVEGTDPTNNAPLAYGKGNIGEGGIRVPAIVRWPGVTQAGRVTDALASSIDIYPTLLAMTGVAKPATAAFDGIDLSPVLRGEAPTRDTLYFHFPHYVPKPDNVSASAVRQGDYKLIRRYLPNAGEPYTYELYDLSKDIGETNNLAAAQPDRVREMDAMIAQHLIDTDTQLPPRNPAYDPSAASPVPALNPAPATPANPGDPVGDDTYGWIPNERSEATVADGKLTITQPDGLPVIRTTDLPAERGPFEIAFRMQSAAQEGGRVFWSPQPRMDFRGNAVDFTITPGEDWHDYSVSVPVERRIYALRIDPGKEIESASFDWIELRSKDGEVLRRWDFDDDAGE